MKYIVTDQGSLRTCCIKHNLFTCGDNTQYKRMFAMNAGELGEFTLVDIALVIWFCSDESHTYQEVLALMQEEQANYMYRRMGGNL